MFRALQLRQEARAGMELVDEVSRDKVIDIGGNPGSQESSG